MDNPLGDYEEKGINSFHIKAMFLAGAGQITDGYDLTAGALVLSMVLSYLRLNLESVSIVLFASIISGNIVGALLFGYLARRGRTKFYGIDALLMIIGALLQAFISTPIELAIARFILGIGIGADYVLSPLLMAEYSNRRDRGKLLGISGGFMWMFGALLSTLATLLIINILPSSLVWRVVLASGAIPSIFVLYERTKMPETPHYLAFVKGDARTLKEKYGLTVKTIPKGYKRLTARMVLYLIIAAACWYLYDVIGYSQGFFGPNVIANYLGVNGIIFNLIVISAFSLPFNFIGAFLSDGILGRRVLQSIGFLGMGLPLFIFAYVGSKNVMVDLLMFGLSNAFNSLGPGNIIGYWGVELFPANVRGFTQGITVIGGRLGVITTTLLFPILLNSLGILPVMIILGILGILGSGLTLILEEPRGKSLVEREISVVDGISK
ncbi:MFS transporter [Sulfolobus sp. D5]|uniref:MFS transporter n=1 Tax=Saccharolobus sp. A20 TaxID=1891280 RepID=UPI0009F4552D|nr:MFS transporter [Sulfolobus sp. A20]TRM78094.1 MFS transporter [Sulfolobus sp. A20-N-F8]TRM78797.1 MFS transporter [Sulfolobus sp. B5]TRM82482.1 MFS transporter [Sulfolobus sp. D5]TRM87524.1 MFS transporter [Sulfolobus sp. E3]TRN01436.1 MFS transporter [Sulfolobus sp. F1]